MGNTSPPTTAKGDANIRKPIPKSTLNYKQQLFVAEYLVDLNATQAAKRAGYSDHTAFRIGQENLHKPTIEAAIKAEIEKRKATIGITAAEVVRELALIGMADMSDFVRIDEGGMIQANPLDTLSEGRSRIVKKVKEKRTIRTTKGTESNPDGEQIMEATYEFELHDKVKALELLAKHLGLLIEKHEDVTRKEPRDLSDDEIDKLIERGRDKRRISRSVITSQSLKNSRPAIAARLQ